MIIAPAFTPWYKNNPAVSAFQIDDFTEVPNRFKSTYWDLKPTIGMPTATPYSQLKFRDLDYATDFGINELTAESIQNFAQKLKENPDLQKDYLIKKIGLDPNDPKEFYTAMKIYLKKGLVTMTSDDPPQYSMWPQICLMTKNITVGEYAACLAKDPLTHTHDLTTIENIIWSDFELL